MNKISYITKKRIAKLVLAVAIVVLVGFVLQELYWIVSGDVGRERTGMRGFLYAFSFLLALGSIYVLQEQKQSSAGSKVFRITKIVLACYVIGGVIFIALFVLAFVFFEVDGLRFVFSKLLLIVSIGGLISAPFVVKRLL